MRASARRLLIALLLPPAALAAAANPAFAGTPAAAQSPSCGGGRTPATEIELFFGRAIAGRLGVTEARWSRFLAREIVPRFPDGLTVIDAFGTWRDPTGARTAREASKVVVIVLPDVAQAQPRIDAVVAAYKSRFRQRSVGVVTRPVCAAF